ncbi:MAG TPA: right-handed parallel beta-helix repeat-containing protein [Candidatus Kapabacteria bacterium]|nr:right-handed parallel beta-helix repeat-containing protein [Candidatus Kapabacteria bacterium]
MKYFNKIIITLTIMLLASIVALGQVSIGGSSYGNLTSAFNAINNGSHTGDIVIKITGDVSQGSSAAVLLASGNGSASYSSIVMYPTGSYTISGSVYNGLIELRGADNVTIDGRANQSGTTRSLTLKNTYTSTSAVIWLDSLTSGTGGAATNIAISYCNFEGYATSSSGYAIAMGASTGLTSAGGGMNNIEIAYNKFTKFYNGIRAYGLSTNRINDVRIHDNIFGTSTSGDQINYMALYLYYTSNFQVYNNIYEGNNLTTTGYASYVYYSNNIKVYNNTVQNITTTNAYYCFYILSSDSAQVYNNNIKNCNIGSSVYGIYLSSVPGAKVYNNNIENIKGNGLIYGTYIASCSGSLVSNNTIKNLQATSTLYGLYLSSCTYSQVDGNKIMNLSAASAVTYGIGFLSSHYSELTNNIVKNLSNSSTLYGINSSSNNSTIKNNTVEDLVTYTSTGYLFYLSSGTNSLIKFNKFKGLTAFVQAYGIYTTSGTDQLFEGNQVADISSNGTGATSAIGFHVLSGNNQTLINNSFSYMRSTNYGSTSTTYNTFGIILGNGTGHKLYFNTVSLSGTRINIGTATSMSAALLVSSTAVNGIDIRNNVFANTLTSPITNSKSYAVYMISTNNLTNSTVMDYNDYYVSAGVQGVLAYMAGDRTTLALWQSITSKEQNSINIDPLFNSYKFPSPAPGSQIANKGTAITGITTDILNEARNSTNPTPGAFENAKDIVGPDISYTKLISTTSLENRSIIATITDFSGVNNSTNPPRIYYRKTNNANTFNNNTSSTDGWKYASSIKNGDQFTFTIDYSKLYGGANAGDDIEYFIVAQDNVGTPNTSIADGQAATSVTSTNLVGTNFPFSDANMYSIAYSLSGTYNIGSGQTYTSLTSDGGFFQYANKAVITGNVNIVITSNTDESGAFQLNKLPYEGSPNWTIVIKPLTTNQYVLSGSLAGAIFRFIGVNNLTIDGSAGVQNGNYLEFNNSMSTGTRAVMMVGSGGTAVDGGKNITITNIKITSAAPTVGTSIGFLLSDGTVSTAPSSPNVNNFTFKNSIIHSVMYAGFFRSNSTAYPLKNLLVENNVIGSDKSSEYIYQYGLDVSYAPDAMIRGNKIYNISSNLGSTRYALQVGGVQTPGINIVGNWIHSIAYTGTGGWGSYGINITSGDNYVIMNNVISDITTDRYNNISTYYNPFAIRITAGSGHRILNNTINMFGSQNGTNSSPSLTAAICITVASVAKLDIRGNIINNTLEGVDGTHSFIYFSMYDLTPALVNCDYNMINYGDKQGGFAAFGTTEPFKIFDDIKAMQDNFGIEKNSIKEAPEFASKYDGHLNANYLGNDTYLINRIDEVKFDMDGEARNDRTLYGADVIYPVFDIITNTSASPSQAIYCYDGNVTLNYKAGVIAYKDGVKRTGAPEVGYTWFKDGVAIDGANSNSYELTKLTKNDSSYYNARAYFMDEQLESKPLLISTEGPMSFTQNISDAEVCNDSPFLQLDIAGAGTITGYQWEKYNSKKSIWEDIKSANQPTLLIALAKPEDAIGKYRARLIGPGNCGPATLYSNTSNVNVTVPITNEKVEAGFNPQAVCKGDNIEFFGYADGTVYGYQWQYSAGGSFVDLPIEEYPTAKTPHLIINNALPEMSGKYRMVVFGSYACGDEYVVTNEIDIYVYPLFEIEDQPKEHAVCTGEDVVLSIYANGQILNYQWYKDGKALTLEENQYAQSQMIQFNDVTFETSGEYYCLITYEDCSGIKQLKSKIAPIYVATSTEITRKPTTQAAPLGGDAFFTFKAHINGLPDTYKIPVQWYKGGIPLKDDGRIVGAQAQILHISNVQDSDFGEDYSLVVQGLCGTATVENFGLVKGDIQIIEQTILLPQCEGTMATMKVNISSTLGQDQILYSWYKDGDLLVDGGRISGANTKQLIISNINIGDIGDYEVKVSIKDSKVSLTSLPMTLKVTPLPAFISDLVSNFDIVEEDILSLSVTVSGNNNQYQWYFNGKAIQGATDDAYIIDLVQESDAGDYYVIATNGCGSVKSNVLTLTVSKKSATSADDILTFTNTISEPIPHPINSISELQFNVSQAGLAELSLIDISGKEIAVLFNGIAVSGINTLKIDTDKLNLVSGTYMLVLKTHNTTTTKTISVIK